MLPDLTDRNRSWVPPKCKHTEQKLLEPHACSVRSCPSMRQVGRPRGPLLKADKFSVPRSVMRPFLCMCAILLWRCQGEELRILKRAVNRNATSLTFGIAAFDKIAVQINVVISGKGPHHFPAVGP